MASSRILEGSKQLRSMTEPQATSGLSALLPVESTWPQLLLGQVPSSASGSELPSTVTCHLEGMRLAGGDGWGAGRLSVSAAQHHQRDPHTVPSQEPVLHTHWRHTVLKPAGQGCHRERKHVLFSVHPNELCADISA